MDRADCSEPEGCKSKTVRRIPPDKYRSGSLCQSVRAVEVESGMQRAVCSIGAAAELCREHLAVKAITSFAITSNVFVSMYCGQLTAICAARTLPPDTDG